MHFNEEVTAAPVTVGWWSIGTLLLAFIGVPQALTGQVLSPHPAVPSGRILLPGPGLNHEPVFGIGPHTTWRGGWGLELELESQGGELVVPVELLYGVTEELTVTAVLPFRDPLGNGSLGSVGFRAKWRLATSFSLGRTDALAVIGGVTVPRSVSGMSAGGPVVLTGVATGRESRRWYYFAGARTAVRLPDDGLNPGDLLMVNIAWGIRPWLTEFNAPDLVLLVEANGHLAGQTSVNGQRVSASGGQVLSLAPAFLLSYRNVMLKGGADVPVWKHFDDPERSEAVTILAALELHW